MAKSDLLKQAIADANAVKETALANAKIALQEAFKPQFENMFANRLRTEIEGEEDIDVTGDETLDAAPDAMMGDEIGAEGDDFNWTDDHLSAEVGGNEYDFTVGMGGEEEDEFGGEEMPAEEMPISDDEAAAEYNEGYNADEMNLEEIIRELEGGDMMATDEMPEDEDEIMPEGYHNDDESDDMNIDEIIESILREEDEMPEDEEKPEDETAEMKAELEEAYRTVKKLTSIINEVNLLNAKLLYTNKLFRNFELTEGQKMKVIENFDRSINTREVKLVFTTLAESFKRPTTKKRVVKESYASKATATTAPKKAPILNEGFELANRWKKLAGLL
jgi:hypothetical protein